MSKEVKRAIAIAKSINDDGGILEWDNPIVKSITDAAYNEINSEKAQKYIKKLNDKFKEIYLPLYEINPKLFTWKDFQDMVDSTSSPGEAFSDSDEEDWYAGGLGYSIEILESGYKKYFDKKYNEYINGIEYKYQEEKIKEQQNARKQKNIDDFHQVLKTQTDKLNMVKNSAAEKRKLLII